MSGRVLDKQPAWLTAAIDQRLALVLDNLRGFVADGVPTIVYTPLTEAEDETSEAHALWDKSCDNCRKFMGDQLVHGHSQYKRNSLNVLVVITFGACRDCLELGES